MAENPKVHSKFDRSHGHGLKAPHLSHPGQVAPLTGTTVPGHNENGHKLATHQKHRETMTRTHHKPDGGRG